jgi:hypothetical protein
MIRDPQPSSMASHAAADRLLRWGTWALLSMWLLGLLSPFLIYVLPLIYEEVLKPGVCPPIAGGSVCYGWCTCGPDLRAFVRAAPLLIASLVLPLVWHRRSLARLARHTRAEPDPTQPGRYRDAPGTVLLPVSPERFARAAVLRYAGRLAMVQALLLPVYFLAWREGSMPVCFHCWPRIVPRAVDYIPLLALSTLLMAIHVPTRGRVLGGLARVWGALHQRTRGGDD